jgi:hypothetical protein
LNTYTVSKERGGYEISTTRSGNIKLEVWSAYHDQPDMIYYIRPSKEYEAAADWGRVLNEAGTTEGDRLVHNVHTLQYYDDVFRMLADGCYCSLKRTGARR